MSRVRDVFRIVKNPYFFTYQGITIQSSTPVKQVGNKYIIPAGSTIKKKNGEVIHTLSQCEFFNGTGMVCGFTYVAF